MRHDDDVNPGADLRAYRFNYQQHHDVRPECSPFSTDRSLQQSRSVIQRFIRMRHTAACMPQALV